MTAPQVTDAALSAINQNQYAVIIVNYANTDMIGHTGNFEATRQAVTVVDQQINRLANAVMRRSGIFTLTADHGNAELMFDPITRAVSKEHTINPVPFILAAFPWHQPTAPLQKIGSNSAPSGILADVAPTLLKIINLPIPPEMTGTPIFNL
jgi:2,3-bisphosphoglycerate-independent phosphoglycerate mutase